jgi:hypothetical protein
MVVLRTALWGLNISAPWVCVVALFQPVFFFSVEISPDQSDGTLHQNFLVNTLV